MIANVTLNELTISFKQVKIVKTLTNCNVKNFIKSK